MTSSSSDERIGGGDGSARAPRPPSAVTGNHVARATEIGGRSAGFAPPFVTSKSQTSSGRPDSPSPEAALVSIACSEVLSLTVRIPMLSASTPSTMPEPVR
ncbi:hypothetical protein SAMN04515671_3168 [Nakamurella panacisegetis]|uniref:Uncharacterized protein n=1 Tax=Nakamurella panacisegetis TaxID=1090615 RepID=A0A1H0QML3_9ACTN|nr:hypothetical protein SAMN04515671_3168 [Nakamurella panacisegetis]